MDDLEDLKARVAAAQEKLRLNADDQRKYGLRLNDVVTIVEGSLARQHDEMKRLQDSAVQLRLERDATRVAENETKSLYEAALSRLNLLQTQNDQLRSMIMTLLNVIEGRETASALQGVLQRLESTAHEIAAATPANDALDTAETAPSDEVAADVDAPAEVETADLEIPVEAATELQAEDAGYKLDPEAAKTEVEPVTVEDIDLESTEEVMDPGEIGSEMEFINTDDAPSVDDEADDAGEIGTEPSEPAQQAMTIDELPAGDLLAPSEESDMGDEMAGLEAEAADEGSEAISDDNMPEDLGTLAMSSHDDIVTDADAIVEDEALDDMAIGMEDEPATVQAMPVAANQPTINGKQDETLVTALLDAEKALIEAGASGVANANSPVAEIIRRISLRTRELSEASGV
jgi:hypothetical protein